MSYGSTAEVAALVPRYENGSGDFDETTRPTLATVTTLLTQVSAVVDSMLAGLGFAVPVTDADVTPMLALFVDQEVAAICEGINGGGRFGPTAKRGGGKGRFALILEDVQGFLEANAAGLEQSGASRTLTSGGQIGYRGTDNSGDSVAPIFQREAFGNSFDDWDSGS